MKKIFLILILLFIGIVPISAKTIEVKFSDCVDGDTAKFIYKKEEITARFLAIDTPETVHPNKEEEPYGKEASEYTCNSLKNASKIELEYDTDSDELDKYDRHLVWVFVDGELLQEKLIEEGLAEVAYLYRDYKYTNILEAKQLAAQTKQIGIWHDSIDYSKIILGVIIILIVIIVCIFNEKFRTKTINKIKNKAKKEINKILKN